MLMKKPKTIILGIDPGYDRLGWGIIEAHGSSQAYIEAGCITTDAGQPLFVRYQQLARQLDTVFKKHAVDVVSIESLFFFKNKKTALSVSEARGVILATCFHRCQEIYEYTPLEIKQTVTGNGRADKTAVEKMIRLQFNISDKKLDDTIDALAVALTYAVRRSLEKAVLATSTKR